MTAQSQRRAWHRKGVTSASNVTKAGISQRPRTVTDPQVDEPIWQVFVAARFGGGGRWPECRRCCSATPRRFGKRTTAPSRTGCGLRSPVVSSAAAAPPLPQPRRRPPTPPQRHPTRPGGEDARCRAPALGLGAHERERHAAVGRHPRRLRRGDRGLRGARAEGNSRGEWPRPDLPDGRPGTSAPGGLLSCRQSAAAAVP